MITTATSVTIQVGGTGQATIDWGDGKSVQTINLTVPGKDYERTGLPSGSKNILVKGEGIDWLGVGEESLTSLDVSKFPKLKMLSCMGNKLTAIDVSKNPALEMFMCNNNKLGSLDVSNNHALDYFQCNGNQLDKIALTTLVDKLPDRKGLSPQGSIFCDNNPGYAAVETTIKATALAKNWKVVY